MGDKAILVIAYGGLALIGLLRSVLGVPMPDLTIFCAGSLFGSGSLALFRILCSGEDEDGES